MITKKKLESVIQKNLASKVMQKKIKFYQILKKLLEAFGQFSGHDHKTRNILFLEISERPSFDKI